MALTAYLDEIKTDFASCEVVAYVDLGSRLVLRVNSENARPQEWLDRLGVAAAEMLNGELAQSFGTAGGHSDEAMIETGGVRFVFVRSPADPIEALCCTCTPDTDIEALTARMRDTLIRLAETGGPA
ncbi:hypothetical protein [Actibacterium sp. XHP0104]|uniref:hypothetical protein n=1 Tax=Actibacterium sp. XHP0104 TaxID=2984335 RepID=UPI0021E77AA7|nr:hypothetical protein [Actibacterium sp. XHP0104]MCV2882964.1 hypothetical protein [Actibacterium sp. XHP0104]